MAKCKNCNLEFNDANKHLFMQEYHILKDKSKSYHYRQSICKTCSKQRGRNYIDKNRQLVKDLKSNTPCKDCGNTYPFYVMHFDHLRDKEFNIGLKTSKSFAVLKQEIDKCDIVCANCHAIRTYKRKNNLWIE